MMISFFSYSQGFSEEGQEEHISSIDSYSKAKFGFSDQLPPPHNLRKYFPNIGNQKNSGYCVAWAYFLLCQGSIIYNKSYNITSSGGQMGKQVRPLVFIQPAFISELHTCKNGLPYSKPFDLVGRVKI